MCGLLHRVAPDRHGAAPAAELMERMKAATGGVLLMLRTWAGLVCFTNDPHALRTLVDVLRPGPMCGSASSNPVDGVAFWEGGGWAWADLSKAH